MYLLTSIPILPLIHVSSIHDGEVRSYDLERKEEAFLSYAQGGYKATEPVASYMSPLSPV